MNDFQMLKLSINFIFSKYVINIKAVYNCYV